MIDFNALFKISYGLYIVSSGDDKRGNGFISNTIFQVTAEPAQFAACVNKNNYTCEFIEKYGNFAVSVLHQNTDSEIFGRFGYKSGRDFNKLEGITLKYGETGVPIIMNDSIAFIECKVVQKFDVGTHMIFIGELIQAEIIDDEKEPITYLFYRNIKKAVAPKNAPTYVDKSKLTPKAAKKGSKKYKCTVCGYIYNDEKEDVKFSDLPDDWTCPLCGAEKEDFIEV